MQCEGIPPMLSRVFVASSLLLAVFVCVATGDLPGEIKGHSGFVYSVAFSPDGEILATGSFDNTIKLWDAKTGKELKTLKAHTDQVYSVSFKHDAKLPASDSKDKSSR